MFSIREDEPSDVAKLYGMYHPTYVVIDEEHNHPLPFGRYRTVEQATMRIQRETERRNAK